jgi:hypothetical protein
MLLNVAGKGRPHLLNLIFGLFTWLFIYPHFIMASEIWPPPASGFATITHYTLPLDYIASDYRFLNLWRLYLLICN